MDCKELGLRIVKVRMLLNIQQKDLAEKVGLKGPAMFRVEHGLSSASTLTKTLSVLAGLGVDLNKLLDDHFHPAEVRDFLVRDVAARTTGRLRQIASSLELLAEELEKN